MKQEAEPASDEIEELAPNVLRLQLPIDMPGLGHVNTYALIDGKGVALVDPGVPGEDSWKVLLRRLADADIPLSRVHTAIVTHSHFDHFGAASQLAEETGAAVLTHEVFTTWGDNIECTDPTHDHGPPDLERRGFVWPDKTPWGTPQQGPKREEIKEMLAKRKESGRPWYVPPHPTRRVRAGDVVSFAGRDWFVHHTPGHTVDHVCFHDPEAKLLISGDHVLPTITPHIAGASTGDPLDDFFASLQAMAALPDVDLVLPAHGHPFTDLPARVESIHEHHLERLETLWAIAAELEDWSSVVTLSQRLFRERSWGPMAESETYAHLEHLRLAGRVDQRRNDDGLLEYRVA